MGDERKLQFPTSIEVFMPLLDGVHPIVPSDLNDMARVLNSIQEALGYDVSPAYGAGDGPKGTNVDVADRLGTFLDEEGKLRDIAFVTHETRAGSFNENVGEFIPFGKQLTSTDYRVLIQIMSEESSSGGSGASTPSLNTPAHVWIGAKSRSGLVLYARSMDGYILQSSSTEAVTVLVLAFGPGVSS